MVSCLRTLRFLEMLPVDILAGWSVLGARQRERVDELDCLFLFQCLRVRQNPLNLSRCASQRGKVKPRMKPPRLSLGERHQWTDSESMESFQQDALRFGCLHGFKHMSLPRGRKDMCLNPRRHPKRSASCWKLSIDSQRRSTDCALQVRFSASCSRHHFF